MAEALPQTSPDTQSYCPHGHITHHQWPLDSVDGAQISGPEPGALRLAWQLTETTELLQG